MLKIAQNRRSQLGSCSQLLVNSRDSFYKKCP
jgi:hypothetical protein